MTAAFFLMLREGLEAALIVGIIAAYLVRIGRRDALPRIAVGVGVAIGLSLAAGLLVVLTVGQLPLTLRAAIEGLASVIAVAVLTWMLFWMRRQGRAIKGELEHGVDVALTAGSTTALVGLAFVAVIREGLETVLFLFAVGASSGEVASLLVASVAGLVVAVAIGWAIFALGVRVDLRRFFTGTGIVLIFVSAGLVAFGIAEFTEAGLLPVTATAFDLSSSLPVSSPIGSLLSGLFGYRAAPTVLEVLGYLVYLVPVLVLFLGVPGKAKPVASGATVATLAVAAAIVLAACGSTATTDRPVPSEAATIEVTADEYAFTPSALEAPAGPIAFHVTNAGNEEHEFEILKGEQVVDEVEGLVPGLDRTLVVTLEPGEYTFVCKLAGHDSLGMTGTLTVNGG